MDIKLENNNIVRFVTKEKKILQQDYIRIIDPKYPKSIELFPMCSWCKKIKMETVWEELDQAINKYGLLTQSVTPSLTHTICEECYKSLTSFM